MESGKNKVCAYKVTGKTYTDKFFLICESCTYMEHFFNHKEKLKPSMVWRFMVYFKIYCLKMSKVMLAIKKRKALLFTYETVSKSKLL